MEFHIEIIGNKMRIQSSPGNSYLSTASATSLTVEIHDEPNLCNERGRIKDFSGEKKPPTRN
jgi:hypothetical protein